VDWRQAALLAATGGAVIEVVALWRNVDSWRNARKRARLKGRRALPRFTKYIDLPADTAAFVTRLALGAVAGGILHNQVVGSVAAITVGASAPALLLQLRAVRPIAAGLDFGPPSEPSTLPAQPVPPVTSVKAQP